ncbi:MAG: hypothetical protein KAG10_01540, partial [Methylococcales bacterium]|nr:hypothetical protein [Methylococcales bacterium]
MLKKTPSRYALPLSALLLSLTLSGCGTLSHLGESIQDLGNSVFGSSKDSEPPEPLTEYDIEVEL